jgi:hypothetical protein
MATTRGIAAALVALIAVGALGGCAQEVYKGPRVVHYTESSFYVRHIPLMTRSATVDAIAADICSDNQAKAILTDAYQDVPFGIRYATYDCI